MPWIVREASHIGGRKEQQDRTLVLSSDDGAQLLLAVADGAGGHLLGAQAAQAAVDVLTQQAPTLWQCDDPLVTLEDLCHQAHDAVRALTQGQGMACTTLVVALLRGDDAYWAHVGDSRLQIVRNGHCLLSTRDHSVRQLQLDRTGDESTVTAPANQLYMCLGANTALIPVVEACRLLANDLVLLCSDGFWGKISLPAVYASAPALAVDPDWATRWVNTAAAGGGDNVTLVAATPLIPPRSSGGWFKSLLARLLG